MKNILVIAPHPDDEVLGCGATIAKLASEGNIVYILVATRGAERFYSDEKIQNVRNEALNAHSLLGVKKTFFLDFPAPELDTVALADISREFSSIINELNIQSLFLPHRADIHNDHQVVFNAGIVAARPVGTCPVTEIYAYETMSETEWAAPFGDAVFIPNMFVDVFSFFEKKTEAMKCFKSQLRDFPNPRSIEALTALAQYRGATVGFIAAEAFSIIRQIVK